MPGSRPSTGVSFSGAPGLLLLVSFTGYASLLAAVGWTWCAPASAQTMTPGVPQPPGIGGTSPFTPGVRLDRPAGRSSAGIH